MKQSEKMVKVENVSTLFENYKRLGRLWIYHREYHNKLCIITRCKYKGLTKPLTKIILKIIILKINRMI